MAIWALLLFLPHSAWAIDGPPTAARAAGGVPAVAKAARSLAFACADNEVDLSITVFNGANACVSGNLSNYWYVVISTASGGYSDYATATSASGATATFDAFFEIGCVAQSEGYIQFVLSYRQFRYISSGAQVTIN